VTHPHIKLKLALFGSFGLPAKLYKSMGMKGQAKRYSLPHTSNSKAFKNFHYHSSKETDLTSSTMEQVCSIYIAT